MTFSPTAARATRVRRRARLSDSRGREDTAELHRRRRARRRHPAATATCSSSIAIDGCCTVFATRWNPRRERWEAGSGAIFDLSSNARRPEGWTSADAAGLAILPGLVRYDEAVRGPIRHALRVTVRATNGYVWPASHRAGSTAGALPMGARLRLKASKRPVAAIPAASSNIFRAMQTTDSSSPTTAATCTSAAPWTRVGTTTS